MIYYELTEKRVLFCSLREMLMEYKRIKDDIPAVLQPPMKPFCDRVEEALLPGVTALTWTALNVDTCKKVTQ